MAAERPHRKRRCERSSHPHCAAGRPLLAAAVVLSVTSVLSLAWPEPAEAIVIPNPLDPIGDVLGAGAEAVVGEIPKLAVNAFGAIIKVLFAWPAKLINRELLAWLVAVPDYAIHPDTTGGGRNGSNLAQLGATTSAMAFAALGAVGTVATIRFWAAGLTGSGGFEALEGLARTVGAALFIVLWPWLFRHLAGLSNAASEGLLGSGSVIDDTSRLLALAFAAGIAFNVLSILIAPAAAVLFIGLLLVKIAVSMTTALVFVGVPLAVMLWPIPELAWIARTAMRAFVTVLVVPLAWAVCFATFAAVGIDAVSLKGAGKFVDALVMPLVAIALLWLTVVLPRTLAHLAMFGALSSGGFISRAVSYVVARRADAALTQALPVANGGLRGQRQPHGHGPGQGGPSADVQPAIGGHTARGERAATAHGRRAGGAANKSAAWEAAGVAASVPPDQALES
jgi:hypothetical protein